MDQPRVAIIVLNYNGRELLERFLPTIENLDYKNFQILVVDNASTDDSVNFLKENHPEIHLVENNHNVGYSQGYNMGVEAASDADYLWLLDYDVRVEKDTLDCLVAHLQNHPDVGIVTPKITDIDTGQIQSLGFDYDRFGFYRPRDSGRTVPSNPNPQSVPYGMGAALLIDRDVWMQIGGFDEGNFIYGDDDYICFQAWLRGHKVVALPECEVSHVRHTTDTAFLRYHNARNRTRVYLKTFQKRTLMTGMPGFLLYIILQLGKDLLIRRSLKHAVYRSAGFIAGIRTISEIVESRERIQTERVWDDARFLTSIREMWLSRILRR